MVPGAPQVQFLFAPLQAALSVFRRRDLGQTFHWEMLTSVLRQLLGRGGDTNSISAHTGALGRSSSKTQREMWHLPGRAGGFLKHPEKKR